MRTHVRMFESLQLEGSYVGDLLYCVTRLGGEVPKNIPGETLCATQKHCPTQQSFREMKLILVLG